MAGLFTDLSLSVIEKENRSQNISNHLDASKFSAVRVAAKEFKSILASTPGKTSTPAASPPDSPAHAASTSLPALGLPESFAARDHSQLMTDDDFPSSLNQFRLEGVPPPGGEIWSPQDHIELHQNDIHTSEIERFRQRQLSFVAEMQKPANVRLRHHKSMTFFASCDLDTPLMDERMKAQREPILITNEDTSLLKCCGASLTVRGVLTQTDVSIPPSYDIDLNKLIQLAMEKCSVGNESRNGSFCAPSSRDLSRLQSSFCRRRISYDEGEYHTAAESADASSAEPSHSVELDAIPSNIGGVCFTLGDSNIPDIPFVDEDVDEMEMEDVVLTVTKSISHVELSSPPLDDGCRGPMKDFTSPCHRDNTIDLSELSPVTFGDTGYDGTHSSERVTFECDDTPMRNRHNSSRFSKPA